MVARASSARRSGRYRLPGFSATAIPNLAIALALSAGALSPAGFFRENAPPPSIPQVRPKLRVIVRAEPMSRLPRRTDPVMLDREIAAGLAEYLGRELELVRESDPSRYLDRLLAGDGDLVAAGLTATPERRKVADFSAPYLHVDELLVQRREAASPARVRDLAGLTVSVPEGSSHAATLEDLRGRIPSLRIEVLSGAMHAEDLVARVSRGESEATVVDSHVWEAIAAEFPALRASFPLADERPIALALRPGDPELRRAVNEFLFSRAFAGPRDPVHTEDLDGALARGRLRMLTRNDPLCYFLHRGSEFGFEYELLRKFAADRGMRVEVVIPPRPQDLVPWLAAGRGDVIAAVMPISPIHGDRVLFTRPYEAARQVVVVREEEADVDGPEDLYGRSVVVQPGSPHLDAVKSLQRSYPGIRIALAPDHVDVEAMLACVEDGVWDAALCNSVPFEVERTAGRRLRRAFELGEESLGWIVRSSNPRLQQALNDYLAVETRGAAANALRRRYFTNPRTVANAKNAWRSDEAGRISPYDAIARKHAARYELDWRLLVAMMQEESGFDPDGESAMGAVGLMQLLPSTAEALGIADPTDPDDSVAGGAKYLRRLIDQLDPKLPLASRVRFALASYNVGIAHVLDAKRLAARKGWRTDRWFGHVERAMRLLEEREYAAQARYGYCRGSECVRYVRNVEDRYRTFLERVPGAKWIGSEEDAAPLGGDDERRRGGARLSEAGTTPPAEAVRDAQPR